MIDLHGATTGVRRLDRETLELTALTSVEADELAFALTRGPPSDSGRRTQHASPSSPKHSATKRDAQALARFEDRAAEGAWTLIGIGSVRIVSVREEGLEIDLATRLTSPPPRLFSGERGIVLC